MQVELAFTSGDDRHKKCSLTVTLYMIILPKNWYNCPQRERSNQGGFQADAGKSRAAGFDEKKKRKKKNEKIGFCVGGDGVACRVVRDGGRAGCAA